MGQNHIAVPAATGEGNFLGSNEVGAVINLHANGEGITDEIAAVALHEEGVTGNGRFSLHRSSQRNIGFIGGAIKGHGIGLLGLRQITELDSEQAGAGGSVGQGGGEFPAAAGAVGGDLCGNGRKRSNRQRQRKGFGSGRLYLATKGDFTPGQQRGGGRWLHNRHRVIRHGHRRRDGGRRRNLWRGEQRGLRGSRFCRHTFSCSCGGNGRWRFVGSCFRGRDGLGNGRIRRLRHRCGRTATGRQSRQNQA